MMPIFCPFSYEKSFDLQFYFICLFLIPNLCPVSYSEGLMIRVTLHRLCKFCVFNCGFNKCGLYHRFVVLAKNHFSKGPLHIIYII